MSGVWRDQMKKTLGELAFAVFGLIVALVFLYIFGIRPMNRYLSARGWAEVPCTINHSQIHEIHGQKGSVSYLAEINYKYQIDGTEYSSGSVSLWEIATPSEQGQQKILDRYPTGQQSVCYVNPKDPVDSVLIRDFKKTTLIGLIPLAISLLLVYQIIGVVKKGMGGQGYEAPQSPTS